MSRITCKQAAEYVIRQHGLEGFTLQNFDANAPTPLVYIGEDVENVAFEYVKQLSDEEKFLVWHSCDDSLAWQEGLYFTDNKTKSKLLEGLAGWALYLTIKALIKANTPV